MADTANSCGGSECDHAASSNLAWHTRSTSTGLDLRLPDVDHMTTHIMQQAHTVVSNHGAGFGRACSSPVRASLMLSALVSVARWAAAMQRFQRALRAGWMRYFCHSSSISAGLAAPAAALRLALHSREHCSLSWAVTSQELQTDVCGCWEDTLVATLH